MKKAFLFLCSLLIVISFVFVGCKEPEVSQDFNDSDIENSNNPNNEVNNSEDNISLTSQDENSDENTSGDNQKQNDNNDDLQVATLSSITLNVSSGVVYIGETAVITAVATLSDGTTVQPVITTTGKSSISDDVLTVNQTGTETITATYTDSKNNTLTTSVEILIKEKISGTIIIHAKYPYIWYWDTGADGQLANMIPEDSGWYYYTFDKSTINVIFRPNGGDNWNGQTSNLENITSGEWWFDGSMKQTVPTGYPIVSTAPVSSTVNRENNLQDDSDNTSEANQDNSQDDINENQENSSNDNVGGDVSESIVTEYYWTNKDGAVGTNKTISDWSDWTAAERIAQNAAYDDPRTWLGIQEVPYDVYALYAAYDDTNLYIMVELTNIVDRANFMFHDYAASDNAWWNNRDIPLGMLFNTGKGTKATKPTVVSVNTPIWDSVDFSDANGFDAMFYHSSKYGTFDGKHVGVGNPGFFKTTSDGKFSYDTDYCLSFNAGSTKGTSGISVQYQRQCAVSKTIYYESTPTGNRGESGQSGESLINSKTYTAVSTNDLDMSYWYTIPLSTLGIDKNYIQTKGIGIRQLTTGGGSLMDCSPWDPSMVDVATESYSKADDFTSHEKEDCDDMTTPLARIGKM